MDIGLVADWPRGAEVPVDWKPRADVGGIVSAASPAGGL